MLSTLLAASLALSPELLATPVTRSFPGGLYEAQHKSRLEQRALMLWPGPSGLRRLWEAGELNEALQVTLLLGGAVFHDPQLLPVYRAALGSELPRVRQAAVYGYRQLIGDRPPEVSGGVSTEEAELLAAEVDAVAETTRATPLVALWLNSLLAGEGSRLPGWSGVVLTRRSADCLAAVDTLARSYDLGLLIEAYRLSTDFRNRMSLMRLIEGYAMQRFLVLPRGRRAGWGIGDYQQALDALDDWLLEKVDARCGFSFEDVLAMELRGYGAPSVAPMSAGACATWQRVLLKGDPGWWPQAADRLYHCGGPAAPLSVFRSEAESNRERREGILKWYLLR